MGAGARMDIERILTESIVLFTIPDRRQVGRETRDEDEVRATREVGVSATGAAISRIIFIV